MSDLAEEVSGVRAASWRECADRWQRVLREWETAGALSLVGLDPDAEPGPDSYPGEG